MAALSFGLATSGQPVESPLPALFTQLGLTPQQRAQIDDGRPVAKVLSWGAASEVYVFGAVYIDGPPATYLKLARDVSRLKGTEGYLAIGELPSAPTSADLSGLTLDPDDIKALKSCREGDCDVQLPTSSIQAFKDAVNWSQPDAAAQVNGLARGMVLDLVKEYRRGGNTALGVYRDKQHPARCRRSVRDDGESIRDAAGDRCPSCGTISSTTPTPISPALTASSTGKRSISGSSPPSV